MGTLQLKTIVVDDEKPSRDGLSTYIRDYCEDISIVAECDSVKNAYKAILKHHPDLVFLDIEMPNGNGFDLLKMFKSPEFKVIFVTAFSEYAIRAFRFSAVDYLLKPVKVDELVDAVNKVQEALAQKTTGPGIQTLLDNITGNGKTVDNLVISDINGFTVIRVPDLILCRGEGYCTHFLLAGKKKVTSSKNLKYYEDLLHSEQFIRVHHSWLVNLKHVTGCTRQGEILLSEEIKCPLGNNYRQGFMERFGKGK
jgi:two-component system, LytTR family, response regulator